MWKTGVTNQRLPEIPNLGYEIRGCADKGWNMTRGPMRDYRSTIKFEA